MWSLDYAIPSLMILAVIIGHYITLPRLPIKKNLVFKYLIFAVFSGIALDIISTWADINYQLFPMWVLYVLNSGYFIMFFAIAAAFFIFTSSILKSDIYKSFMAGFLIDLPINLGIIFVLITPWTKWYYYIDAEGYHSGPLYNYLYFIWAFYILMSFIAIASYKKNIIKKREFEILIGCNIILAIGLIARYAFPHMLLMVIFILIAFIVIFLGFENPDRYLEEHTLIFNRAALRDYLRELIGKECIRAFVLCDKGISDRLELYGIDQTYQGTNLVQNYLKREFPNYLVFNYGTGRFVLFARKKFTPDWDSLYLKLTGRFMRPWVSRDTEIYFDLGASLINIDATDLSFEIMVRVLEEAFSKAESGDESNLQIIDNSLIEKIKEDAEIKRALDYAIEHDTVGVFLQPIVESQTGKIAGAEALARIKNSEGGLIPPGLFIPIAEKNGKINKLGKQVFKKCCDYINNPEFKSLNLDFINVNLSPIQFLSMDLNKTLNEYIENTYADRDCIHLEITEEAMIDEQLMDKQIAALTGSGFKFVLDDYGKGYSNMSRLRKTPFINIKLDMSLVWDYCSAPNHILPSEVDAFKKSGFEITAEGIEDEDMANKMRDIGCTYLQGYYFSKPLPFEEFVQKYKAN